MRWPCGPLDAARAQAVGSARAVYDAWLKPESLAILEHTPVNAIVITWAAGAADDAAQQRALQPLITAARARGIDVIGRISTGTPPPGLNGILCDKPGQAPAGTPVVLARAADALTTTEDAAIVLLTDCLWPRIPVEWRGGTGDAAERRAANAAAGPTGAPWVDANGWRLSLARAKAPAAVCWSGAEPPEDAPPPRWEAYALAVADAAIAGGRWLIRLDAGLRAALAARQPSALELWKSFASALRRIEQLRQAGERIEARLGVLSHFTGEGAYMAGETLNLAARRHLPVRPLVRDRLAPDALRDLKAVLWADQRDSEGTLPPVLHEFIARGGLAIVPPALASRFQAKDKIPGGAFEDRYDLYRVTAGRVALARKPWMDPFLLITDAHLMLGRKHDVIRLWNAGSMNVQYTRAGSSGRVQLVNFAARGFGHPVSLWVAQPYRAAALHTLDAAGPRSLEPLPKSGGVEVYLPSFPLYGSIEFGA